jgi:YbbR domain-containing protein
VKKFFTENVGWKLFSLAMAVLLWVAVSSEPELATFISVPVEFKNLPPNLEINSDVVETVFLEVRGPSGELRALPEARHRYAVVLDMRDVQLGSHTFTIDREDVRIPRDTQLVRAIPAQIRLDFEPGAMRPLPVNVRLADSLPADLNVVEARPDPDTLRVTGPASRVARLTSVETDPIHLNPVAGVTEYRAEAWVSDSRVRFEDSPMIKVKVTIGRK